MIGVVLLRAVFCGVLGGGRFVVVSWVVAGGTVVSGAGLVSFGCPLGLCWCIGAVNPLRCKWSTLLVDIVIASRGWGKKDGADQD